MKNQDSKNQPPPGTKFGTFGGVFTPCTLTILGVIMFLRFGQVVGQAGILLGDLNAIAPVITMFFMITYGTLKLACFYESITRNPSYRPKFRFSHWSSALLGAIGCLVVMFLMNPLWALVAVLAMSALYGFISRSEIISRWGDVTSGVAFERARRALLKLEDEKYHPKNL
ncbi:MAG: hypothetical protein V2I40_15800 [Desulfobacteraceae bacterium]|jgi:hypothetical protein|nr:hypothetical protein [Desulfobacteraceae bacterium]